MKLRFLGAAGAVTGSKSILSAGGKNYLIDCGLFQGLKELRLLNWRDFPVAPHSIEAVLLTHAHIDHSGYIPVLTKNGFRGKIYCTEATESLCNLLLPDAGFLQEEDAAFANKHGFSKHRPALPLFTMEGAKRSLRFFKSIAWEEKIELSENVSAVWREAGHILGASFIELSVNGKKITFSGDLGRFKSPLMHPPKNIEKTDYLILESTYGDHNHPTEDPAISLKRVIDRTIARNGSVLIPAFAIGRTQQVLYYIHQLKKKKEIPDIPVFVNSPMATLATDLFCRYSNQQALSDQECKEMTAGITFVGSAEQSRSLNAPKKPCIIISASGMATGGRVLHHLKFLAPDPKNTILFIGYQAPGTRGHAMLNHTQTIKIHGEQLPVRAEVNLIGTLSAHADQEEIMTWLRALKAPPKKIFLNHGEQKAREALKARITKELRWDVAIPNDLEEVNIS
ncbi:MAG: MBL fold metallo-hydrolase [Deltaproteobacteria bacterium]|nr:MBL fold metallo-hydrolase [Deltaproteobacteria bacterium]